MKEKIKRLGFTLIELLAVIVILAIIALIATPVILNIIGRVRRSAFERSVENVIKAGDLYSLEEQLSSDLEDIRFECDNNSCISSVLDEEGNNKKLNISGSTGTGYILVYKNGDIELALEGSGWCAVKSKDVNKVSYTKGSCKDIKKNDTTEPIITNVNMSNTTNSIKVVVNVYDNESGISKYKYELSGVKSEIKETNENIYTFENLEVGTYSIKITVYNGNNLISEETKEITLKPVCPLPIITVSNKDEWMQSKTVTIDYGSVTGCTGKYSLDGSNFTTGNTVTINENNKTIYAVNEGGSNSALSEEIITKIDVTEPTLDITNEQMSAKTIEIDFSASDSESNIKNITCEYGTSTSYGSMGKIKDNKCTIENLIPNTTYYYKITANDNVLNNTVKSGSTKTLVLLNPAPGDTKGLLGIVYLNPNTGKACSESQYNTNLSSHISAGNPTVTNLRSGCMKWYVYKKSGNTLIMILDHNAISNVPYNSTKSNTGMKELQTALNELKGSWKVSPRLIGGQEIADITENTNWPNGGSMFYFDSSSWTQIATSKGASKYYWLYDYTRYCESNGCNVNDSNSYILYQGTGTYSSYGYWTSTPDSGNSTTVLDVDCNGYLGNNSADDGNYGLRPVIEISE